MPPELTGAAAWPFRPLATAGDHWAGRKLCRFSDAETPRPSMRAAAGVRKAPRHEIAGCGALMVPRMLWGFSRGVGPEKGWPKQSSRSLCHETWLHVSV